MNHVMWENKGDCSGCKACAYVCPTKAISYGLDTEGFAYPEVDEEKCVACGKCVHICPQVNDLSAKTHPLNGRYGAKHTDAATRAKSRSGGAFVAISDEILRRGGSVYGAVQTSPFEVKHLRAETKRDRDRMCGSKYVQSDTEELYPALAEDIQKGKPVLFTGTPCQCAAVYQVFGEKENLYLCDFLCHGVPSLKVWRDYLTWLESKYRAAAQEAEFREKGKFAWKEHVEKVAVGQKTVYSRRFTNLFYQNAILRPSCYECRYTTPNRVTDITLADYWGIDAVKPEFNDGKGVSLVMTRTEKGKKLFEEVLPEMEIFDAMPYEPPHYNLKRPTARPENREQFWLDYGKRGFVYVSAKYGGYDILRRIKHKLLDHID